MKRPIGIIITDTHLHKDNIEEVENIIEQAGDKCMEYKTSNLFHAGDWFTNRLAQPLPNLTSTQRIINSLIMKGVRTHIIPGNHDKVDLESKESYLDIFHQTAFTVHDEEEIIFNDSAIMVWGLPYFKENGSYKERLARIVKKLPKDTINILLTHIAVNGVRNNDGSLIDNDLTSELFDNFHSVFVGHYHNQSKLGNNIYYIGSSHAQNFGEDNTKGVTLLYNDGSHEFVKLKFKEFHKQVINVDDLGKCEWNSETYKDHNVRIIIKGDASKLASFNKSLIPDWVDYKFETEEPMTYEEVQAQVVKHDKGSLKQSFQDFALLNEIENKELHLNYLQKL
jgi:DNA repair protein SbcD/Mre11